VHWLGSASTSAAADSPNHAASIGWRGSLSTHWPGGMENAARDSCAALGLAACGSMRTVNSRDLPRGGQRVMASLRQTPAQARSWWRQHTGQARGSDATGTLRERDGGQGRRSWTKSTISQSLLIYSCFTPLPPHRSTEVPHRLQRLII
jgi:hypothetical protein